MTDVFSSIFQTKS
jgi:hypothetical protein